ncbi:GNAT family N-acetyltransferase [Cellulomonas iranensis]|uniref:GNAT family N-acetyltransferase n=1 Tax=Cellulomonas iranensis TaxID=76862 RepID=UPI001CF207AE|nr:GNAT family N-acetyltransferase [Cellulomonas iranensis]UCN15375.1 GNAT family N-acetyltransferase [Cellulomonas iranensis]
MPGTTGDVRVERVAWDDADARVLRDEQQAELRARYGDDDVGHAMTGDGIVATVLVRLDGAPVACGVLRDVSAGMGAGTGEVKRMYVRPDARGRGLSRRVLAELEDAARAHGCTRLVLETGVLQPEAIGLYLAAGYRPVENYGEYVGVVDSRCFERDLAVAAPPPRGPRGAAGRRDAVDQVAERAVEHTEDPAQNHAVEHVAWRHPDAVTLRRAMLDELAPLYPEHAPAGPAASPLAEGAPDGTALTTVLLRRDGVAVACATLRAAPAWGARTGELKRLYVAPAARGAGLARHLVRLVEDAARERGLTRVVLDTGIRQPAAIALYRSLGYRPVRPVAGWEALPFCLWFARDL